MKFINGQLINPEKYRNCNYTISPFSTKNLESLEKIQEDNIANKSLLTDCFGNHEYTMSGKDAIYKALSFYNLDKNDEVFIVTTSGNTYVSNCVTTEIEKHCRWKRTYDSTKTKLIFVIHEFGTTYSEMQGLEKLGIPIIEDFAMTMFSAKNELIPVIGDLAIYSLPKFFPVQFGGILRYNNRLLSEKYPCENKENFQQYLESVTTYYFNKRGDICDKRKQNFNYYQIIFDKLGLKARLNTNSMEIPSVFMFSSEIIDLHLLKVFLQYQGIECSIFYGENSFFLPVHQELSFFDIRYIADLIKYFIHESK